MLLCRRHWIYLWPRLALQLVLAVAPVVIIAWLLSQAGVHGRARTVFWLLAVVYLLLFAVRMVLAWYVYRHDIWVITSQRIVDSLKRNPFNLRISTADLVNIQDMTVVRNGILRTVLDYGDLFCQTAAEKEDITISGVANPRAVQALVDRERDRERRRPA